MFESAGAQVCKNNSDLQIQIVVFSALIYRGLDIFVLLREDNSTVNAIKSAKCGSFLIPFPFRKEWTVQPPERSTDQMVFRWTFCIQAWRPSCGRHWTMVKEGSPKTAY